MVIGCTLWCNPAYSVRLFAEAQETRWADVEGRDTSPSGAWQLVGRPVDTTALIEPPSRASIVDNGGITPDTAVAVLRGTSGGSINQMRVLQHGAEPLAETRGSGASGAGPLG